MKPIVTVIDAVTAWAKKTICPEILLKVPPENDAAMDAGYSYTLDHPEAIPMYKPTGDKLPIDIQYTTPSICVYFVKAGDSMAEGEGYVDLQLLFSVWDPGQHGEDVYLPNGDGSFRKGSTPDFQKGGSGWRDVWNFVDIARRALESTTSIDGLAIDKQVPIEYGPVTDQETIVDFYPYWYSVLSFRVTYPLMRNNEDLEQYL